MPSPPIETPAPHPEWLRRHRVAADYFLPWIDRVKPLRGSTVLEYGCGQGAVLCALAPLVERAIGYDIDDRGLAVAHDQLARRGADHIEARAEAVDSILDAVSREREVDVFLMYAVLEHMTVSERLDLLRLARDVVTPDGVLVIVESPNRLVDPDFHTSFLPFFSQLPDELAVQYFERSPREDFVDAMRASANGSHPEETYVRWGRGISFHELEVVFDDLPAHVIAGGFDTQLLDERKVHAEELALARYMERVRPDLPPCFSRYWIDCILSPEPVGHYRSSFIWPWTFDTRMSPGAAWTPWDVIQLAAYTPLNVTLPVLTQEISAVVSTPAARTDVRLVAGGEEHRHWAEGQPGTPHIVRVVFDDPSDAVELSMSEPGFVHFVGYEAALQRGLSPVW